MEIKSDNKISDLVYNELLVELYSDFGDGSYYTFNITKDMLSSNYKVFRNGYYISSTDFGDCYIQISKNSIGSHGCRHNGQPITTLLSIYYK